MNDQIERAAPMSQEPLGDPSVGAAPQADWSPNPCRRCRNLNLRCDFLQPSCDRCSREAAQCIYDIEERKPMIADMSEPNGPTNTRNSIVELHDPPMSAISATSASLGTPVAAPVQAQMQAPPSAPRSPSQFMYTSATSTWAAANNPAAHAVHVEQPTRPTSQENEETANSSTHDYEQPVTIVGTSVFNSNSNDDNTPQRQQGKRKRTSCADCHKRKLKCDREYPACGRCRKRGVPCYYDEWSTLTVASSKPSSHRVRPDTPPKPTTHIQSPARPLYGPLTGQPQANGSRDQRVADDHRASTVYGTHGVPYSDVVRDQLFADPARRESEVERPAQRQRIETPGTISHGTMRAALRKEAEMASFQSKPGKAFETQFNGPTNPFHSLMTFPELASFTNAAKQNASSLLRVREGMRTLKRKNKEVFSARTDADLVHLLPSDDRLSDMVRDYFHAYSHIYPVVHEYHFRDQLDYFKDSYGRVSRPGFVAVLLLVLACASVMPRNEPLRFVGANSLARYEASRWIKAAESWLDNQSAKHQTLEVFQVHCLLLIACKVTVHRVKRAWAQAGGSLRAAMSAGMHCDPGQLDKNMNFFDQEMRRRIFATLVELELSASIDRGMPATLVRNSFTCPPPTNVDDFDFRHSAINNSPEYIRDEYVQTSASFLIASRNSYNTRSEVITILNDLSGSISYNDVLSLDRRINQELEAVPTYDQVGKSVWLLNSKGMVGLGPAMAQLQLLQLLILLHTPYAVRANEDPRYKYSQIACMEAAERIFDIHKNADEDRRTVLSLLRNDMSRTCLAVCQIILASSTGSGTLFTRTLRAPFLGLIDDALTNLELKVLRLGTGFYLYWLVSAAYHLVLPLGTSPTRTFATIDDAEKGRYQHMAADRVTNLYYKLIANQESAPPISSAFSNVDTMMSGSGQDLSMNGVSGTMGINPGNNRWYGAAAQASEADGGGVGNGLASGGAAPSTNGGDFDFNFAWPTTDDLMGFAASELYML